MKIESSKLREWNTRFEFSVKYNISDCSTYPLTLKELFSVAGQSSKKEFEKISLGYTQTWGAKILRQAIAETYQNLNFQNILVTNGAIEAIFLILNMMSNPGDEMICLFPIYQALSQIPIASGVKIKRWNLKEKSGYAPDFEQLESLITPKTKAIIINQPHVPTGFMFQPSDYLRLIELAKKRNLYLVADEVCRGLYLEAKNDYTPAADLYEKAISIGDFSKPYGAGGLRIGWLACQDKKVLEKCLPWRGYTTMSNSTPSEFLAWLILQNKEKVLKPRLETAQQNYNIFQNFVQENNKFISVIKPCGGVTAFPKYSFKIRSDDFCRDLIEKENVLLVPSNVYGIEGCFRIGFGCKTGIFQKGINGLKRYLKQLKGSRIPDGLSG